MAFLQVHVVAVAGVLVAEFLAIRAEDKAFILATPCAEAVGGHGFTAGGAPGIKTRRSLVVRDWLIEIRMVEIPRILEVLIAEHAHAIRADIHVAKGAVHRIADHNGRFRFTGFRPPGVCTRDIARRDGMVFAVHRPFRGGHVDTLECIGAWRDRHEVVV